MPGVKVLLKGLNKVIEFPSNVPMEEIERAIKGNWDSVSEIKGLPMDSASRRDRARYMGMYDPTLYHGTSTHKADGKIFNEFELFEGQDMSRSVSRSPVGKLGVSIAEQPNVADDFAKMASPEGSEGSAILPLKFRSDRMASVELSGDEKNHEIFGTVVDLWKDGYDSVRFTNYTSPGGEKGSFFLVKDPAQLRSTTAAFDPSKKDSSNLLAGVGGASAAVGLGALGSEDASAQGQPTNPLAPNITPPLLSMEQLAKLPSHLRPDVGRIQGPIKGDSDVVSAIQDLGSVLSKFEVPALGNPLEGLSEYMQNFGYNDSQKERLKRAAMAVLDFL